MNSTHVTIQTKNDALIGILKDQHVNLQFIGEDKWIVVIPVCVEARLIDFIVNTACDTKADAVVYSYYQDGSGLDVRMHTMTFKNGVCVD